MTFDGITTNKNANRKNYQLGGISAIVSLKLMMKDNLPPWMNYPQLGIIIQVGIFSVSCLIFSFLPIPQHPH